MKLCISLFAKDSELDYVGYKRSFININSQNWIIKDNKNIKNINAISFPTIENREYSKFVTHFALSIVDVIDSLYFWELDNPTELTYKTIPRYEPKNLTIKEDCIFYPVMIALIKYKRN